MPRSVNDGLGRLGGREKGTPNRKSLMVESLIDLDNINLPFEVLKCCENLKPLEKANVLLKLMEFIYPKRKAIALVPGDDSKEEVTKITFRVVETRDELIRLEEIEKRLGALAD